MAEAAETGVPKSQSKAPLVEIFSPYMENISVDVVDAQRSVVSKFLRPYMRFTQVPTTLTHAQTLRGCLDCAAADIVIFLDIDCVPLCEDALIHLVKTASLGYLVGAVQRANHIDNGGHLYVGPFCMAFSQKLYRAFGNPTFDDSDRWDVGEKLSYEWGVPGTWFIWPTRAESPQWKLTDNICFGYGTTYGDIFYHEFCSRFSEQD
jgi:hypothetical protein